MSVPLPSRQFLLFLIAGGMAAAVNFLSRIALGHVMGYVSSIVIAYALGMATAFTLNKLFVFNKASNELHHQVMWFVLVNLAAVVQTLIISLLLARWLLPALHFDFHNETVAHAFGVAVPVVTSYIGHKKFSFRT